MEGTIVAIVLCLSPRGLQTCVLCLNGVSHKVLQGQPVCIKDCFV